MFSFLIEKIAKNSKKQFRNAHSMVITPRIMSCNLKVDWNFQNKCESRIKVRWTWSNLKNASCNFCSASLQSTSKLITSKLKIKAIWWRFELGQRRLDTVWKAPWLVVLANHDHEGSFLSWSWNQHGGLLGRSECQYWSFLPTCF